MEVPPKSRAHPFPRQALTWILGLFAGAWFALGVQAAPAAGILAMLDGEARLIRGATRYQMEEGLALSKEDIIETGANTRLVRIELQDGAMFDLGPSTRVMLAPPLPSSRSKAPAQIYLLQGWVKWTAGRSPAAVVSATLDVQGNARSVVIALTDTDVLAFAEAGEWTVFERGPAGAPGSMMLRQEQFYLREGTHKGRILDRPTPAFVQAVPRAFTDSLPPRMGKLGKANVTPKRIADIAYADVQAWIDAEPALRRQFIPRWRSKALEPDFRKGLQAGMSSHPEWDRIVNPEKYLPKPSSGLVTR